MRHFGSLLVAAVFAPSIFLLTGTGLSAFNSALDDNKVFDPLGSLAALGALLLAGVLYGILVMARLSPLGPGLAGLASWGISGWALLDIETYRESFTRLDVHMGGAVGESGLGIMLGIPLLATIFSGRRWRRDELYAPQAMPVRPPADPTWVLPATPAYQATPLPEMPLPDVPAPSLRYPVAAAFQGSSAGSSWRTPPYVAPVPEPGSDPPQPVSPQPVSSPPVSPQPADTPSADPLPADAPPASSEMPPVSAPADPPTFASAVLGLGPSGPAVSSSPPPAAHPPESTPPPVPEVPASGTPLADLPAMESVAERLMSWSASSAPDSEPPTPIVMAAPDEAPPLPRRVPAPPPGGRDVTAPMVSPPPDNEVTQRLGTPGSIAPQVKPVARGDEDETVQ